MTKKQREASLNAAAAQVLVSLRISNSLVEVFLLPDRQMRELERRYLKKDKPVVDVLAFPSPGKFPRPDQSRRVLGEVYLNWDLYRHDPSRLRFLMVHGVLHLLGYRHERRGDIIKMEALERRLCKKLEAPGAPVKLRKSK